MKSILRKAFAHTLTQLPRGFLTHPETYNIFQAKGVHVIPVHFYSSVPNTLELKPSLWDVPSSLPGIDQRLPEQIKFLETICEKGFMDEYHEFPYDETRPEEYSRNGSFGEFDGAILWSMIRTHAPKRIIEIGSGGSSVLMSLALEKNADGGNLVTIDPYPAYYLRDNPKFEIVKQKIEDVPLEFFDSLGDGDMLFIDSSHTVRIGGDVLFEVLELLPRLKKGVIVHIHDIFLPEHYPKDWVLDRHSTWTEQYLVQAFLAFNSAFEVLWGFNMMRVEHADILSRGYGHDMPLNGSSLWLRKTA